MEKFAIWIIIALVVVAIVIARSQKEETVDDDSKLAMQNRRSMKQSPMFMEFKIQSAGFETPSAMRWRIKDLLEDIFPSVYASPRNVMTDSITSDHKPFIGYLEGRLDTQTKEENAIPQWVFIVGFVLIGLLVYGLKEEVYKLALAATVMGLALGAYAANAFKVEEHFSNTKLIVAYRGIYYPGQSEGRPADTAKIIHGAVMHLHIMISASIVTTSMKKHAQELPEFKVLENYYQNVCHKMTSNDFWPDRIA